MRYIAVVYAIIKLKLIKKLSIDTVTDSDELALWLDAFVFYISIASVNTWIISSQNEL